jgi:hypothetical protein
VTRILLHDGHLDEACVETSSESLRACPEKPQTQRVSHWREWIALRRLGGVWFTTKLSFNL